MCVADSEDTTASERFNGLLKKYGNYKLHQKSLLVGSSYLHEIGSVFVDEGAEGHAVPKGRGHVGDGNIPVAVAPDSAPLLQRLHSRHPGAQSRTQAASRAVCRSGNAAVDSQKSPSLLPLVKLSTEAWTRRIREVTAGRWTWESPPHLLTFPPQRRKLHVTPVWGR